MIIKLQLLLLVILLAIPSVSCNDFSPKQQCIQNKCKNAFTECYLLNSAFYSSLLSGYSTSSSSTYSSTPTDYAYSESYTTEYGFAYYNGVFSYPESFYLSTTSTNYIYSGGMISATDVDIFYVYASSSSSYGGGGGTYKFTQSTGSAS